MTNDVDVLIASRNERWLKQTIDDVLLHAHAQTGVIVVLDGNWPLEPIPDHPRVTLIHHAESIGQRAAVNEAARVSRARYIVKLDAHCSVDDGFDVKLMQADEEMGRSDLTQIPAQYNLHVFDWQCRACGDRTYQGPTLTVCAKCGKSEGFDLVMVWKPRLNRRTEFWVFDSALHFQYQGDYRTRPEAQGEIVDVMSNLGACWFMRRERFWQLGGLDESHGSWGQMGTCIACKSWLSGGRQVVNKRTHFSHLFRTRGGSKGDFGFPYPLSTADVDHARAHSRELWLENGWPQQVRPLSWLVEKFWPVKGWTEADFARIHEAGEAFARRRIAA